MKAAAAGSTFKYMIDHRNFEHPTALQEHAAGTATDLGATAGCSLAACRLDWRPAEAARPALALAPGGPAAAALCPSGALGAEFHFFSYISFAFSPNIYIKFCEFSGVQVSVVAERTEALRFQLMQVLFCLQALQQRAEWRQAFVDLRQSTPGVLCQAM